MCTKLLLYALVISLTQHSTDANFNSNQLNDVLGNCPLEDSTPICASNGYDVVMFPSECLLNEMNSFGKTIFQKIAEGFCENNCNLVCTTQYAPLCAINVATHKKRTFRNRCELDRDACLTKTNWIHYTEGECASAIVHNVVPKTTKPKHIVRKSKKAIPCPEVLNPVCATYGGVKSTFSNECLVNAENIRTGADWTVFSQGACAEDSTKHAPQNQSPKTRSAKVDPYKSAELGVDLGEGVTYIYTPSIFQTQFISDVDNARMSNQNYHRLTTITTSSEDDDTQFYNNPNVHLVEEAYPGVPHAKTLQYGHVDDGNVGHIPDCQLGHMPICGTFEGRKRTYSNICDLMMRNMLMNQTWTVLHEGPCDNCAFLCSKEYHPICVTRNGLNYTMLNECHLNVGICQDKLGEWKVIGPGECKGKEKTVVTNKYESVVPGFRFTSNYMEEQTTKAALPMERQKPMQAKENEKNHRESDALINRKRKPFKTNPTKTPATTKTTATTMRAIPYKPDLTTPTTMKASTKTTTTEWSILKLKRVNSYMKSKIRAPNNRTAANKYAASMRSSHKPTLKPKTVFNSSQWKSLNFMPNAKVSSQASENNTTATSKLTVTAPIITTTTSTTITPPNKSFFNNVAVAAASSVTTSGATSNGPNKLVNGSRKDSVIMRLASAKEVARTKANTSSFSFNYAL